MKRVFTLIITLMLALAMMVFMASCGNKPEEETVEEPATTEQEEEQGPEVTKTIDEIDTEGEIPLQIASITLFEDGTVLIVPTDDLKRNEMKDDEDAEGIYPFADSGKVKDIEVMYWGNAGFRTIVALMDDGTISAVNGGALINDHIIAVMNTVGGRDNFVSIENKVDESAWTIVGHTEDGESVVLDYSLNFTEEEQY